MIVADIIAGIAIGALSGMGVGGAGLLVIYLTALRGLEQRAAQGVNLYFFIFASAASMFVHAAKRKIDRKNVLTVLLGGMPAAYLGCLAASATDPDMLRKIFGGMLVLTGVSAFFKQKKKRR
ncbi:MAG: sulfite exporter TauE/SafE family protein [Clostridia bacterium]|nr:sulfite exporter TauE/SafE family protein [Clostridia bacterium]